MSEVDSLMNQANCLSQISSSFLIGSAPIQSPKNSLFKAFIQFISFILKNGLQLCSCVNNINQVLLHQINFFCKLLLSQSIPKIFNYKLLFRKFIIRGHYLFLFFKSKKLQLFAKRLVTSSLNIFEIFSKDGSIKYQQLMTFGQIFIWSSFTN